MEVISLAGDDPFKLQRVWWCGVSVHAACDEAAGACPSLCLQCNMSKSCVFAPQGHAYILYPASDKVGRVSGGC